MTNSYNEENIRIAAYYIWEQAGRPEGQEVECWNKACQQLYSNDNCGCNNNTSKKSCSKSSKTTTKNTVKATTVSNTVKNSMKLSPANLKKTAKTSSNTTKKTLA